MPQTLCVITCRFLKGSFEASLLRRMEGTMLAGTDSTQCQLIQKLANEQNEQARRSNMLNLIQLPQATYFSLS